jgi:polysaccharide biosynthesis/export protein
MAIIFRMVRVFDMRYVELFRRMSRRNTIAGALLLIACLMSLSSLSLAQVQPSQEQLKYFRSLSASEQRSLAQQFGISIPDFGSGATQQAAQLPQTIYRHIPEEGAESSNPYLYQAWQSRYDDSESNELPIFGMSFFSGQAMSFTPIGDLPVPVDYLVAPGDQVNIQVYGKINEQYSLVVSRDGAINIPNLGPFSVVGKKFSQLRDELRNKFQRQLIGVQIAVSMGELHAMQVYILGDARQPGAYQLSSLATATQAIIAAGGIADSGSLRHVRVLRGREVVAEIDLYELLLQGKRGGDIRLQSGDAVFVAPAGPRVEIDGEVLRPAIYELSNERTSLDEVLAYAGGVLPGAHVSGIRLERFSPEGVDVFSLDVNEATNKQFMIKGGDKLFIDQKNKSYRNSVQLVGAFINPGQHGFRPGMRVADLFSNPKSVLRDDADSSTAILVRKEEGLRISVHYIPILEVLGQPDSDDNIVIQAEDEILVLPAFVVQPYPKPDEEDIEPEPETAGNRDVAGSKRSQLESARNNVKDQAVNTGQGSLTYNAAVESEYESRQRRLMELMELQEQKNLSAEEARLKKEELEDQATQHLEKRRAELLAPIMEKLKEQANSESYQQVVEIAGEVKYPGSYPYMQDMSLGTLIHIAGGLKENAFSGGAELARLVQGGEEISLQTNRIPLKHGAPRSIILKPRDRISIFERPEWRDTIAVRVTGEVRFPGTYTVVRGTGFKELLRRVGGLTEFAFPRGAVFSRTSLKEKEQEQIERLRRRLKEDVATLSLRKSSAISGLSVSPSEAIEAVEKLSAVEALGRLVVDLPALLSSGQSKFTLEDGDFLHIPSHSRTVTVVGEVQYPSSHLYEEGIDYKEYLQRAGGARQRADTKRIYIIRANGQVVVPRNTWFGVDVTEGDTIVVPINAQYVDKLSVFGSVTSILYQLGVAYDVIKD